MLDRLVEVLAWYGGIMAAVQVMAYANRHNHDPAEFIFFQSIYWGALTLFGALFYIPSGMILGY